jgi:hypothetical protein
LPNLLGAIVERGAVAGSPVAMTARRQLGHPPCGALHPGQVTSSVVVPWEQALAALPEQGWAKLVFERARSAARAAA